MDDANFDSVVWITTNEAAALTGYTPDYVRKAIKRNLLKGTKRGRDWFVERDSVLAYVEKMKRLGTAKHNPWKPGGRKKTNGAE